MNCPHCGSSTSAMGNPVTALYDELRNDRASWTDAIFWMILGGFTGAVCERLFNVVIQWVGW